MAHESLPDYRKWSDYEESSCLDRSLICGPILVSVNDTRIDCFLSLWRTIDPGIFVF